MIGFLRTLTSDYDVRKINLTNIIDVNHTKFLATFLKITSLF